jgi:zinc protease
MSPEGRLSETPDSLPIREVTLDSGMRVVVLERRHAPVVAVQVWVQVGAADEHEPEGGIAHVHEHMLFKGTEKRGVGEIAAEIEGAGGDINAWTSLDQTVYHVTIASRFFDTAVDVLSDALLHSSFDPDELERELEVILEEIKRAEDQPGSRVSRALFRNAYQTHPYGRPVIGHADVVRGFTREQIVNFYQSHYRPERFTLVIVGDVDADEAIEKVGAAFDLERAGDIAPLADRPAEPEQNEVRAVGLTDDVEESHLAIGFPIPAIDHEDVPALDVLSVILGQGESSRLVQSLRRERTLVNDVYAYAYTPREAGMFVVGASLPHGNLDEAAARIGEEIARVVREPPEIAELEKAKAMLASEAIYQLETVEGLARRIGYWQTMVGDPAFEQHYQERVRAIRADDVRHAAARYLQRDRSTWVTLVPDGEAPLIEQGALDKRVDAAFRKTRPRSAAPTGFSLTKLESGARLILDPEPQIPVVALRLAWLGGLRVEDEHSAGYGNLVAEMLTAGTAHESAREIARRSDAIAARLSGFSGRNSLGFRTTCLADSAPAGFDLATQCLLESSFPDSELERTKRLVLEDLKNRADNPAGLCFMQFHEVLWRSHPYGRDVLGKAEQIKGAPPAELAAFFRGIATREDAVVCIGGDFDPGWAVDWAEALTARLPERAADARFPDEEAPPTEPRVARKERERAQAHVVIGNRGLRLDDDDRFALEVMCAALSGQGGRLFLELRDRRSLCYSVSAFSVDGVEPGSFAVYMGTSPDKLDEACTGISDLLEELRQSGLTAAELERAQRYLIGTYEISLQRVGARASTAMFNELYGVGFDAHRTHAEKLAAVTGDDVLRVAQRLLDPQTRVTSVVAPPGAGGPR